MTDWDQKAYEEAVAKGMPRLPGNQVDRVAQLIVASGTGLPVSSCCHAPVERTCDYTDTHLFDVTEADVDEDGKVISARYTFRETYDGTDGENVTVTCQKCGQVIDQGGIDWDEA